MYELKIGFVFTFTASWNKKLECGNKFPNVTLNSEETFVAVIKPVV